MVDAATQEWHDSSGLFTKVTVEKRILPILNEKLGFKKLMFTIKAIQNGLNNDTIILTALCVIVLSLDGTPRQRNLLLVMKYRRIT